MLPFPGETPSCHLAQTTCEHCIATCPIARTEDLSVPRAVNAGVEAFEGLEESKKQAHGTSGSCTARQRAQPKLCSYQTELPQLLPAV